MTEILTWFAAVNPSNMQCYAKSQDKEKLVMYIREKQATNLADYPFVAFPAIRDTTYPEAFIVV